MTVLPGDPPVFRNKWCGLSGDLSVTLVLGIMCHHTSCMGGEPAQRWGSHPSRISPAQGREEDNSLEPQTVIAQSSCAEQGTPTLGGAAALQRSPGGLLASIRGGVHPISCASSFFIEI